MPDLQQNERFEPPRRREQTILLLSRWHAFKAAVSGGLSFRVSGVGFLLLSITCLLNAASSLGQIKSVAISPDGKLLAMDFEKGGTSFIYKIPVDTGVAARLTDAKDGAEFSPAFSPDGKRIAYLDKPGDHRRSRIVVVDIDGSDPHQWPPSDTHDSSPVFSPDNKTVIFARYGFYGSYSPIAQPHPHDWSLYAADLDGSNVRQLASEHFYMLSPPSISQDGKNVVVVTEALRTNRQIAIYSLDRVGEPILTLRPHVPREADHKNPIVDDPNYMPDGKSVLFMAASNGKHGRYDYDIYRVDLGTKTLERLTNGNGYATNLRVSMDGKTAVFLKWRSDRHATPVTSEPYLLDIESHRLTPLQISGLN